MKKYTLSVITLTLLFSTNSLFAQVCKPEVVDPTTPTKKFKLNGDGTITDKKRKLMWTQCLFGLSGEQCDQGEMVKVDWEKAKHVVYKSNLKGGFAGFTDWYLPNAQELVDMVEGSCYDPAINRELFPNAPATTVWSRSIDGDNPNHAWGVNFYNGNQFFTELSFKSPFFLVRSTEKKKKKKDKKKK